MVMKVEHDEAEMVDERGSGLGDRRAEGVHLELHLILFPREPPAYRATDSFHTKVLAQKFALALHSGGGP
jgi:hypothetical protein